MLVKISLQPGEAKTCAWFTVSPIPEKLAVSELNHCELDSRVENCLSIVVLSSQMLKHRVPLVNKLVYVWVRDMHTLSVSIHKHWLLWRLCISEEN